MITWIMKYRTYEFDQTIKGLVIDMRYNDDDGDDDIVKVIVSSMITFN